ncbi:MAG: flagellar motor protein MotA [Kiloniellales bacterium]
MTRFGNYILRMVVFLLLVGAGIFLLRVELQFAFFANPWLNGIIIGVLFAGILYIFRNVFMLKHEVDWIEGYKRTEGSPSSGPEPRLLAPMATMLGERKERISLSTLSMRSLLDGISSRLAETREFSRYMIGLLVFLGLLGTFWGLLRTVESVGGVIADLEVGAGGDMAAMFGELKGGLQAPLAGMGTAFSSSLFGLAGSLILGFLELTATQAQNRFYNDLEEWLSGLTRLSSGSLGVDGEQPVPAVIQALLEQTAESLDELQRIMVRGEEGRAAGNNNLLQLTERVGLVADQMRAEQDLFRRLAESQRELVPALNRLSDAAGEGSFGIDDATRNHLRNIEVYSARLLEELSSGRNQAVQELRKEIRLLARTMATIGKQD